MRSRTLTTICAIAATCFTAGAQTALAKSANPGGASAPGVNTAASGGAVAGANAPKRKSAKKPAKKAKPKPKPVVVVQQQAPTSASAATTGGQQYTAPTTPPPAGEPTVAGSVAKVLPDGQAEAPLNAPRAVQEVIWTANKIVGLPYLWGGGHQSWNSPGGYDCSGTVSYALHGAGLLNAPLVSGDFMNWGAPGNGQWISIEANDGHVYMYVAGIRLDTSAVNDPQPDGPRWRPLARSNAGFTTVHPVGL